MKTPRPGLRKVKCCVNCRHVLIGCDCSYFCHANLDCPCMQRGLIAAGPSSASEALTKWELENLTDPDTVCLWWDEPSGKEDGSLLSEEEKAKKWVETPKSSIE